jgi:hypothetical protein
MPQKKIFIFYDGTWCGDTAGTYTNIKRLTDSVARREVEEGILERVEIENGVEISNDILIYYKGVGLNGKSVLNYLVNGAISFEIKDDCIKTYKFIVNNYESNDEIWMFGLSRGAYIVRSVAGLINNCGILQKKDRGEDEIQKICEEFYEYYKNRDEDYRPDKLRVKLKGMCHETNKPPIKFMGLIDTVGALGIPKIDPERGTSYEFYDQNVSSEVENVYQALAIHDRLSFFTPCFIKRDERKIKNGEYIGEKEEYKDVRYKTKQVWFPGAHYDIGDQYFTFGADFNTEDMMNKVDEIKSKLQSILSKNKSNVIDMININFVLRASNFEIGTFVKKVLRHYLNKSKLIKIEPNPNFAKNVYEWMIDKISETDRRCTTRKSGRHERSGLLRGDVYEKVLDELDLLYLKDIILKDRVIQPWTPRKAVEAVTQTSTSEYNEYKSETLSKYNLISNGLGDQNPQGSSDDAI